MQTRSTLILTALLALAAPAARAAEVNVTVQNFVFLPATVNINVGDTVTWTNVDGFHDVRADDNSFSNLAANAPWKFSHTFTTPGTFGYRCTIHGGTSGGMRGTVVVGGGGGQDEPGTLRFSQAAYSIGEAAGNATITVQRVGGDDGAVTVAYSATPDSAAAGTDFIAVSGTLSWADNDDNPKTFQVPINNDTASEGNETVDLTLSNATGGAALDPVLRNAVLTLVDDDAGSTGPCVEDVDTLCVNNDRFAIEVDWRTQNENGFGSAVPVPTAPDSGLFHFFGAANIEMLIKVLNACGLNDRYWVFYAATTNVEFTVTVTDTQTGRVKTYFNPLNTPAPPIQDTDAFDTCP